MELKGKKIGIAFCGSFCTFDKGDRGAEADPVYRGGGAYRAERISGSSGNYSLYGEYGGKAGERDYGYGGIDGGKSASQKREASRYFYFHERWIGNEYEKYRHIIKYKKCVFCSFRAG